MLPSFIAFLYVCFVFCLLRFCTLCFVCVVRMSTTSKLVHRGQLNRELGWYDSARSCLRHCGIRVFLVFWDLPEVANYFMNVFFVYDYLCACVCVCVCVRVRACVCACMCACMW